MVQPGKLVGTLRNVRLRDYPFAQLAGRRSDLEQIVNLGRLFFGADAFSREKFEGLLGRNDRILWVVKRADGVVRGYLDMIPISKEFGRALLAGEKKEADITPGDVIVEETLRTVSSGYVYLATIMTRSAVMASKAQERSGRGPDRTFIRLVWAAIERVVQISIQNPHLSRIIAIGYRLRTGELAPGVAYLPLFGFRQIETSPDGHPVFLLDLDDNGFLRPAFAAVSDLRVRFSKRRRRQVTGMVALVLVGVISALIAMAIGVKDIITVVLSAVLEVLVGVLVLERLFVMRR